MKYTKEEREQRKPKPRKMNLANPKTKDFGKLSTVRGEIIQIACSVLGFNNLAELRKLMSYKSGGYLSELGQMEYLPQITVNRFLERLRIDLRAIQETTDILRNNYESSIQVLALAKQKKIKKARKI